MKGLYVSLAASLLALQSSADVKLVSLGTHVYGPKLTLNDLKGHVVVVEKWGIN